LTKKRIRRAPDNDATPKKKKVPDGPSPASMYSVPIEIMNILKKRLKLTTPKAES